MTQKLEAPFACNACSAVLPRSAIGKHPPEDVGIWWTLAVLVLGAGLYAICHWFPGWHRQDGAKYMLGLGLFPGVVLGTIGFERFRLRTVKCPACGRVERRKPPPSATAAR